MKFYCTVNSVEKREKENFSYYILKQTGLYDGVVCFPSRKNSKVEEILNNGDFKNQVFEIEYYSYKTKQGVYKNAFRVNDILPCFPVD